MPAICENIYQPIDGDGGLDLDCIPPFEDDDAVCNPDLPERWFVRNHFPRGRRVHSYSKPEYLVDVALALKDSPEMETLMKSQFGKLFEIPLRKLSFSGQLVHALLARQVECGRPHEAWFVFGGQPLKFSVREFCIVTGLKGDPYAKTAGVEEESGTNAEDAEDVDLNVENPTVAETAAVVEPHWDTLIGKGKSGHIDSLVHRLSSEKDMEGWKKLQIALLIIVEGVVLGEKQDLYVSEENVEKVKDVAAFCEYSWGRKAFELTMKNFTEIVKRKDMKTRLQCPSLSLKGFPLAMQLLAFETIPKLVGQLPYASAEDDFTPRSCNRLYAKKSINYNEITTVENDDQLIVDSILHDDDDEIDPKIWAWSDDEDDVKIAHVENLLKESCSSNQFGHRKWPGGEKCCPRVLTPKEILLYHKNKERKEKRGKKAKGKKKKRSREQDVEEVGEARATRRRFSDDDERWKAERKSLMEDVVAAAIEKSQAMWKDEMKEIFVDCVAECVEKVAEKKFEELLKKHVGGGPSNGTRLVEVQPVDIRRRSWSTGFRKSQRAMLKVGGSGKGRGKSRRGRKGKGGIGSSDKQPEVLNLGFDDPRNDYEGVVVEEDRDGTPHGRDDTVIEEENTRETGFATGERGFVEEALKASEDQIDSGNDYIAELCSTSQDRRGSVVPVPVKVGKKGEETVNVERNEDGELNSVKRGAIVVHPSFVVSAMQRCSGDEQAVTDDTPYNMMIPADQQCYGEHCTPLSCNRRSHFTHPIIFRRRGSRIKTRNTQYDSPFVNEAARKRLGSPSLDPLAKPTVEETVHAIEMASKCLENEFVTLTTGHVVKSTTFFDIATPRTNLNWEQMAVLMLLIWRRRAESYESKKISMLDSVLPDLLVRTYDSFKKGFFDGKFSWDSSIVGYLTGNITNGFPKKQWVKDAERIYMPMKWKDDHWVGLVIHIVSRTIEIVDSFLRFTNNDEAAAIIEPLATMLPYLIREVCRGRKSTKTLKPFKVSRADYVFQDEEGGNSGPITIKYLEMHSSGVGKDQFRALTSDRVVDIRGKYGCDLLNAFAPA